MGYVGLCGTIVFISFAIFGAADLFTSQLDYVVPDPNFTLTEETVDIHVSAGRVAVCAEYVFRNDADEDKTFKASYPFGKGHGLGPAENVSVTDGASNGIPFERKKKKIIFDVRAPASAETKVRVTYEQPTTGTTFTYLLGKDRFWGLGGASTAITVTAPASFGKIDCNYPLKIVDAEGDKVGYVFARDDFYPQMNFFIDWKNPPSRDE
jgi:hypothetical protein